MEKSGLGVSRNVPNGWRDRHTTVASFNRWVIIDVVTQLPVFSKGFHGVISRRALGVQSSLVFGPLETYSGNVDFKRMPGVCHSRRPSHAVGQDSS